MLARLSVTGICGCVLVTWLCGCVLVTWLCGCVLLSFLAAIYMGMTPLLVVAGVGGKHAK